MERGTIIHGFSQSGLDYQLWSFLCFLMATELSPMLSGSTRQGGRRMLWIQFVMIILIFQDLQKQIWSRISCFLMTIFTNTDFNKSKQHQQPIPDSLLLCWQNPLPHWCLQCTSWFGMYLGVSLCCTSLICCLCLSEEVNRTRKIFFWQLKSSELWNSGGDMKVDLPITEGSSWADPAVCHKLQMLHSTTLPGQASQFISTHQMSHCD